MNRQIHDISSGQDLGHLLLGQRLLNPDTCIDTPESTAFEKSLTALDARIKRQAQWLMKQKSEGKNTASGEMELEEIYNILQSGKSYIDGQRRLFMLFMASYNKELSKVEALLVDVVNRMELLLEAHECASMGEVFYMSWIEELLTEKMEKNGDSL